MKNIGIEHNEEYKDIEHNEEHRNIEHVDRPSP